MEEQREESQFVGDVGAVKGVALSTKEETLVGEDANNGEVPDSGVCDVGATVDNSDDGGSANEDGNTDNSVSDVKDGVAIEESGAVETEDDADKTVEKTDGGAVEVKPVNGESHETGGEAETVISAGNEVTDDKANGDGDDSDATTSDTKQNDKSHQGDGETLSVAEDKADQEKNSANESGEDNKIVVDSQQANQENVGSETNDAKHSESVQVPEVSSPAREEEELTNVNQKEENGEAMEIDPTAEEQVEKDVLDNAETQDVPADRNESNVVEEMEVDERKDNADMAGDLTESAYSANPNSSTEDAAPGEVEPLDDNALFDPRSDITNFIDFSGVSCWSGNTQDLKTETGNVSLKEDKKATDMAEEVATEDCNEATNSVDATVNAESRDKVSSSAEGVENESSVATECQNEASDAIMGSEENREDKDHQYSDQNAAVQQDTTKEEDDTTHEAPSIDPNQNEDAVMEENPNNSDYADVGTDTDTKTNGVKRKADVLSDDSLGESRKTVSSAKVSSSQRPSFKIGACIARAASQMAGSPSVLKGTNVGDETLPVESFVSQLHSAATDPVKENVVSAIANDFFLDFRNSSASQQYTPETVSSKKGRPSNSNAGGTEAFEFEEMGDTYWTDRVIHNGGEEQTPPADKESYQVVPVELKPAQVKRTRRPYRRRQSQIISPLPSASDKPADFDENSPAELIMNFSETDTIPPEKSLSKMFRHFGPIRDSQTEVDPEKHRARVVFRKGADAEAAYNSAGRFNIFGTKAVNYELSFTITETFKVQPYVVSLGEEEAALSVPS